MKAIDRKQVLSGLYERLGHLGVEAGTRRSELATANERLAPLAENTTDSHRVLTALLATWPDRADDPIRAVVQGVDVAREALAALDDRAREHLARGQGHPGVGPQVTAHLEELASFLTAASAERPLSSSWIRTWNTRAQDLISQMIGAQPPAPGVTPRPEPPRPPPPPPERVVYNEVVNLASKSAIGDAVAKIKAKLDEAGRGRFRVTITREDD